MSKAVILLNVGTPDSYEVNDVRRYLNQFLMDKYIITAPYLIRRLLVSLFILPFRPKKSAEAYKSIWLKEGSPLLVYSRQLIKKLRKKTSLPIALGMGYGSPSIKSAIDSLIEQSNGTLSSLFLIPLYPQFADATVTSGIEATKKILKKYAPHISLQIAPVFYDHPKYIDSITEQAKPYNLNDFDHILLSYHGLPEKHIKKADPTHQHCLIQENCCNKPFTGDASCYRRQAVITSSLIAKRLQLPETTYSMSFQSRLGPTKWLEPSTISQLKALAEKGIKSLLVFSPAFVTDCLETIEELGQEAKNVFISSGGEHFQLVPCMNDNDIWVSFLTEIIEQYHSDSKN